MSSKKTVINGSNEQLLTISDAANLMGVNRGFVAKLVDDGELSVIFVGTQRRIPRWMLQTWQDQRIRKFNLSIQSLVECPP